MPLSLLGWEIEGQGREEERVHGERVEIQI